VTFSLVTPELTELICERLVRHSQKKLAYFIEYLCIYTRPIFAIFTPYESALGVDDKSGPYFPIWQETLPWQPNNFAVMEAN